MREKPNGNARNFTISEIDGVVSYPTVDAPSCAGGLLSPWQREPRSAKGNGQTREKERQFRARGPGKRSGRGQRFHEGLKFMNRIRSQR